MQVALPFFWFLLGRWLWRFFTWGRLLRDIARCDLRLVATHPDHCAGLAFIGQYPNTYWLFVFALSTVVAATVLKHVKPIVGTESCQAAHTGYVLEGRMVVKMADGSEVEFSAGDAFYMPPGHDAWTVGNQRCVLVDVTGFGKYAKPA